jgi:hypothetical protein
LERDFGITAIDLVASASASPVQHEVPGPDPKNSSEVWGAGDIIEDSSHSLVAIYSPEFGITDIKHAYNAGPTYFFGTFDECVAWIAGRSGYFVVYSAEDVPPSIFYDAYSFSVSVSAVYKANQVSVTFNDVDKTFDVLALSPGVYGYSETVSSGSQSSGHGPDYADWTVTGHVNADMQSGTLVLAPEDTGPG